MEADRARSLRLVVEDVNQLSESPVSARQASSAPSRPPRSSCSWLWRLACLLPAAPSGLTAAGFPLLRTFRLARPVEGDRLANERLEGGLINFFSFVDVDRPAYVSFEARVEKTGRILQRSAL